MVWSRRFNLHSPNKENGNWHLLENILPNSKHKIGNYILVKKYFLNKKNCKKVQWIDAVISV